MADRAGIQGDGAEPAAAGIGGAVKKTVDDPVLDGTDDDRYKRATAERNAMIKSMSEKLYSGEDKSPSFSSYRKRNGKRFQNANPNALDVEAAAYSRRTTFGQNGSGAVQPRIGL